jgi:toxin-antitoxin system PIN domain toxin
VLLLDVNVVLAAHRADHPQHALVRPWLDDVRRADEDHAVPSSVWGSFLRLTTNRRIFPVPSTLEEAFAFVDAAQAHPRCRRLEPGERHLALVRRLCEESGATGDLVPDAVLAAVALEHGATVASLDRDFARFTSVQHVRPGDP